MKEISFTTDTRKCKPIFLPREITPDLLYFVGAIVGDGSLPKRFAKNGTRKYVVTIEKANLIYLKNVLKPIAERLFRRKWSFYTVKKLNRKIKYTLCLNSKPLYIYLSEVFEIPQGRKSHSVRMPLIVRRLPPHIRLPFIAGVMDTDWGRMGKEKFGTHCSSRKLLEDINGTLTLLIRRKYKIKKYVQKNRFVSYQLSIPKSEKRYLLKVLKTYFPLRNEKRIHALSYGADRFKV